MKKWLYTSFLLLAILIVLSIAILCVRFILSEKIDLTSYNTTQDAERYLALPFSGDNFEANSLLCHSVGRHYLKGKTAATITAAYAELAQAHPEWHYIYGEMGWNGGGRFRPHRTHQHGMSADFITPVYHLLPSGEKQATTLPTHIANLWGYNIRIDDTGQYESYYIDTAATIAHIAALQNAGAVHHIRIKQVILDPPLLELLRTDPTFASIADIPFMNGRAWFPHDGHYHIDFEDIP